MKYTAIIGRKPQGISQAAFDAVRKSQHCANYLNGTCKKPCELDAFNQYHVDVDHIVPRCKGGSDDASNLQLLCRKANRWEKGASDDPRYKQPTWWDQPINLDRLRKVQVEKAWNEIHRIEAEGGWISEPPNALLDVFMLMMWVVGSGKTIGMITVFKAINAIRNASAISPRRIKRLLVLAPQRALVDQLADELRYELTANKISKTAPSVYTVKYADDWFIADQKETDIVVACDQAVWERESRTKKGTTAITEEQLGRYLSSFEGLAVDEGHFAIEQHAYLAKMMPRAFKVSMTATPMDRKGQWLKKTKDGWELFALLSVYGYESAYQAKTLRYLGEWDEGERSYYYRAVTGGDSSELKDGEICQGEYDTKNTNNMTRDIAVIKDACEKANELGIQGGYDAHVMMVCGGIKHAKEWEKQINGNSRENGEPLIDISNSEGWRAVAYYADKRGHRITDRESPWMLAKFNQNKVTKDSARIACVVDIGQYGVNNKCCNTIAWIAENLSMVELVQRIGRALRRTNEQDSSSVVLRWPAKYERMTEKVKEAIAYIHNMESLAAEGGHRKIIDLLNDKASPKNPTSIKRVAYLNTEERSSLEDHVGEMLINRGIQPHQASGKDVEDVIIQWQSEVENITDNKIESASKHATKILRDQNYRKRSLGLTEYPISSPLVVNEQAPNVFTDRDLIAYVENMEKTRQDMFRRLREKDVNLFRDLVNDLLMQQHARYYTPPVIKEGSLVYELRSIARSVMLKIMGKEMDNGIAGEFYSSTMDAAARYFGLPNVKKTTVAKFEAQMCDVIWRGRGYTDITGLACAIHLRRYPNRNPKKSALYQDIIEPVEY